MKSVVIKDSASDVVKGSKYTKIVDSVSKSKSKSGVIDGINFILKKGILYLF